jgi:uncharacterized protein DUF6496
MTHAGKHGVFYSESTFFAVWPVRKQLNTIPDDEEESMAKYGKAAGKSVESALHREKKGTLRSGKGGRGGRVTSRKQAIAIGLSEARKKGAKVPAKK